MNHLLDDENDIAERPNRELTLSTGTILGIFVVLVLSWGLFFGIGFNMGSHRSTDATSTTGETSSAPSTNFSSFKPAAGSPAGSSASSTPAPSAPAETAPLIVPPSQSHAATPANTEAPASNIASVSANPPASVPLNLNHPTPAPASTPASPAAAAAVTGSFMVQIAAVSPTHKEDADYLVTALKAKGYAVATRTESQDQLIHVQVGPFTNRKDADTMRQRLLADGYNAIIK